MTATAAAILQPNWEEKKSREQVLQEWLEAKEAMEAAKEREQVLRKQVVEAFPFDPQKQDGIEYVPLANGYKLKVQKNLRYILDTEMISEALDRIEQEGETGKLLADRLVKWKPELSVREYRLLPDEYRAIIDKTLTTKDGMPTLELVEPKGK